MDKILTFNGKIATGGGRWITRAGSTPNPYNPYNLAPRTVRFQFPDGAVLPSPAYGEVWTQVDTENNIWDVYAPESEISMGGYPENTDILGGNFDSPGFTVVTVYLGRLRSIQSLYIGSHYSDDGRWKEVFADTNINTVRNIDFGNATNIHALFAGGSSSSLSFIDNLNIPSVTNMSELCNGCTRLTTIPRFFGINGQITDCNAAFYGCRNIEYGIIQLYEQLTAVREPSNHNVCFRDCGVDSPAGQAELAQIPSDWK